MTVNAMLSDTVGMVRLRGPTDTPASRLAVKSAVERMDWRAGGPSPRAILLVRRLVGTLDARSPGDAVELESQLRQEIDRYWRSAVPLDGRAVPTTAPAVVARDLVELLAMYLVDCSDGVVAHRWWWRSVGRQLELGGSVSDTLVEHARVAPQLITDLIRRRRPDVVAKLGDTEARRVIIAIATAHELPGLVEAVEDRSRAAARPSAPGRPRDQLGDPGAGLAGSVPPGAAPALLTALAIRLVDAPASARSPSLVSQLITDVGGGDPVSRPAGDSPIGTQKEAATAPTTAHQLPPQISPALSGPSTRTPPLDVVHADPVGARNDALLTSFAGVESAPDRPELARARPADGPQTDAMDLDPPTVDTGSAHTSGGDIEWADPSDSGTGTGNIEDGVASALGGVFFLVELTRQLDLPDVFEPTWGLSSTVGAWGVLELVARSLLPFNVVDHGDPVWQVLADLGGGKGGLERAKSLPARAPATVPNGWPDAGVPVDATWSIDDTLARDARQGARRLLTSIAPAIRRILAERLDCEVDTLTDALFRRSSWLFCDRTHVDVHLLLDSATVGVRRAGFDRDPGWVPAYGRVISFHFDSELPPGRTQ